MLRQILACYIGLFVLVSNVVGQDIDPRGIYFNRFVGQFSGTEIITITTDRNTVRITDPGGLFFQGVFEDGLTAGYRVVANPSFGTTTGIYATFPGSSTNIGQDLLGAMNMISINQFRASFILQTRTPLGNQNQILFEFQATRLNPYAEAEFDQNA